MWMYKKRNEFITAAKTEELIGSYLCLLRRMWKDESKQLFRSADKKI